MAYCSANHCIRIRLRVDSCVVCGVYSIRRRLLVEQTQNCKIKSLQQICDDLPSNHQGRIYGGGRDRIPPSEGRKKLTNFVNLVNFVKQ